MVPVEPTFSVVIPCYNQGRFLGTAVESVLIQNRDDVEVIVVDDGSTDNTREVAASYGAAVRTISKRNAGLAAARNTGILAARGDYLVFLDADDYHRPGFLDAVAHAITEHPDVEVWTTECDWVGQDGSLIHHKRAKSIGPDPLAAMLYANPYQPCQMVVRRQSLANAGLFDVNLRACEDWDMWMRLARAGASFVPVEGAVPVYRRYPGSMSADYWRMRQAGIRVFAKFLATDPGGRYRKLALAGRKRYLHGYCFSRLLRALKYGPACASLRLAASASLADPAVPLLLSRYALIGIAQRATNALRGRVSRCR